MTGIEKVTGRIIADAHQFEEATLEAAKHDLAELNDKYSSEAEFIRARSASRAARDRDDVLSRAESTARLEARGIILSTKSELVDHAYKLALERLTSMDRESYIGLLFGMLTDSVDSELGSERENAIYYSTGELVAAAGYELLLNSRDRGSFGSELIDRLNRHYAGSGKSFSLSSDTLGAEGGFILRGGDVETDCTLASVIASLRENTESGVCSILFE